MKQMESRKVIIGGNEFFIRPLPAFKAANLTGELAALVGPMLSGLAPLLNAVGDSEEDKNKNLMDLEIEDAAPSVAEAFSSISGDQLERLLRHLLVSGKNISCRDPDTDEVVLMDEDLVNEIFCQDVQDMFLLAFEVIRTNYSGFFKKLAGRFGKAFEETKKAAQQIATESSI